MNSAILFGEQVIALGQLSDCDEDGLFIVLIPL